MISQCANCGNNFEIISDEVMFCSPSCKREHDLFKTVESEKIDKKIARRNARQKSTYNTLIIT